MLNSCFIFTGLLKKLQRFIAFPRFSAERMSGAEVVESLRGKVLEKEEKEDGQQWTPYNANMSMQGIKVSKVLVMYV